MTMRLHAALLACWLLGACAPAQDTHDTTPSAAATTTQPTGTVSGTTASTGNPGTSGNNPNTPTTPPVILTIYVQSETGAMSSSSSTVTLPVSIPWVPSVADGNCNIGCNTNDINAGLFRTEEGEYLVGFIGVPGLYVGQRCLPLDANTTPLRTLPSYNALCASHFPQCAGDACWAHGGTGGAFNVAAADPNRVGLAIGSTDYWGAEGCYVRCVQQGNTVGFMRVAGNYQANICRTTAHGTSDITNAYGAQCGADFPVCANNACTASGDLTAMIANNIYNPGSIGSASCFLPVTNRTLPNGPPALATALVVPGSDDSNFVCTPLEGGVFDPNNPIWKIRAANAFPRCDAGQCTVTDY